MDKRFKGVSGKIYAIVILLIATNFFHVRAQDQFKVDSLLTKYNSSNETADKVNLLMRLAQMYELNDIKKCFEYANQAYLESEELKNYEVKARALSYMGVVFLRSGSYDKAMEMFLQSKAVLKENDDEMRVVGLELNLGAVHFELEDYDGALQHFNEALQLNSKLLDAGIDIYMKQIQIFYINIGSVYLEKGNYSAAIEYFTKALDQSQKNNDLEQQGIAHNNMADAYLRQKLYGKAHAQMLEALQVRQKDNNLVGIASSYNLLTKYFLEVGEVDSAQQANDEAVKYAERVESLSFMEEAYEMQSQILELKGDYKKANASLKKYYDTKRQIVNESVVEKTTRLQLEYDFNEMREERAEANYRHMVAIYSLLGIVAFLLVVFVLLYNLWRSRAKRVHTEKESLEKDLELKNRELTTNVMYLLKKHELINNVSERLLRLKTKMKTENKDAIQRIIFDLQGGAEPEVWEEFELRFQNVHTDFYKKLEKIAPDLTPSELKICAFLKLNMNSKEISALIHQSTKSVEVKRSRIRKKLGLTNTDINLIKYLSEL
ncbi:tetratricopeptide repeat protein [Carboxylicivirga sp. A043]|uniref:tetratricopeptide repeat protein n=1 Tax=Carboxylicivirga litoralis TaxID=2816963 RepID=UPI0021CB9475|nr:tetratricopeptide repeat protein [Carboxylicivirga sp. A043]MCU4155049.1 tetratricopeptide repeat protein [Carboxylicivirga sp. A043]